MASTLKPAAAGLLTRRKRGERAGWPSASRSGIGSQTRCPRPARGHRTRRPVTVMLPLIGIDTFGQVMGPWLRGPGCPGNTLGCDRCDLVVRACGKRTSARRRRNRRQTGSTADGGQAIGGRGLGPRSPRWRRTVHEKAGLGRACMDRCKGSSPGQRRAAIRARIRANEEGGRTSCPSLRGGVSRHSGKMNARSGIPAQRKRAACAARFSCRGTSRSCSDFSSSGRRPCAAPRRGRSFPSRSGGLVLLAGAVGVADFLRLAAEVAVAARSAWYIGCSRSSILVMPNGRRSKCLRISFSILSSVILPVPKVVTEIEVGSATPMA